MFAPHIDRARIGAAGFSLGGYTVISLAGGRFTARAYEAFCSSPQRDFTCEPQPEFPEARAIYKEKLKASPLLQQSVLHSGDSYRDARIGAVFAIAPALGGGFAKEGLDGIRIPVHIAVGDTDTVCPAKTNAEHFASLIPGARLTVLPGGVGHYTFLAECTEHGKEVLPICKDRDGVDRAGVHRKVAGLAFDFFEGVFQPRKR